MSNAAARPERAGAQDSTARIQAIDGGITAPAGFKAAGVYAGIKPPTHAWPLDVMLMTADRACLRRRRVHDEQDAGGACARVSRESGDIRGPGQGDRLQQRVRERLHRRRGDGGGALDRGIRRAACWDAGPKRCSSRRPASLASISACRRSRTASRRRSPRSAATRTATRMLAIMTTDPFPKEAAVRVETPAGTFPRRRHDQGLGHDRADDGDDARISHVRRAGGTGDAAGRRWQP